MTAASKKPIKSSACKVAETAEQKGLTESALTPTKTAAAKKQAKEQIGGAASTAQNANIVVSKCGHDKGELYVTISTVNQDFILLVDGNRRKLANPKLKRKKHTSVIGKCVLTDKPTDSYIRKTLKTFAINKDKTAKKVD